MNLGEFDVLATLRRAEAPHRRSPMELFKLMMVSSGTMTNWLNGLEQAGLVARMPDARDRVCDSMWKKLGR